MNAALSPLITATAVFLGIHVLPSTPLRGGLVRLLGEIGYIALFSVASAAALIWMAWT